MIIFKKEKEVIELIEKHADKASECLAQAAETLGAYLVNDIQRAKNLARQVDSIEAQADMIRHDIRGKLYSGAYMPILREDIYKLVESIDKVANAAEESCDFFLNQRPEIPDDFKADYLNIVQVSMGIGESLKHAVLCYLKGMCPTEVSRGHARDIGLVESKVDSLEWDLSKKIFSSDLDIGHKTHLRLCLDTIVEISDRAEDSADQLELVTFKSIV